MSDKMTYDSIQEYEQNTSAIKTSVDIAFYHMLLDSRENDEDLKPLKKLIFDTGESIDRPDVEESLILKFMYSPKLTDS